MRRANQIGQKNRSLISIFVAVLTLSSVAGAVQHSLVYAGILIVYEVLIIALVISWTAPLLVFFGVYLVARNRNIDLRASLVSLIVLLIVGAYTGNFIGHAIITLIFSPESFPAYAIAALTSSLSLYLFFAAFTALAVAYVKY